nr:unnamed protein product [Callosobruchus analis]
MLSVLWVSSQISGIFSKHVVSCITLLLIEMELLHPRN